MKKYLIVKCEPLNDQYECDANRILRIGKIRRLIVNLKFMK